MKDALARLLSFFSPGPSSPPLVAVTRRITGRTVEETLDRFEDAFSEENYQSVVIQEQAERRDGTLVRYQVLWKYSVFDDDTSGFHESWALVVPADPGAGDPPDAPFRVDAATQDHHMRDMSK